MGMIMLLVNVVVLAFFFPSIPTTADVVSSQLLSSSGSLPFDLAYDFLFWYNTTIFLIAMPKQHKWFLAGISSTMVARLFIFISHLASNPNLIEASFRLNQLFLIATTVFLFIGFFKQKIIQKAINVLKK